MTVTTACGSVNPGPQAPTPTGPALRIGSLCTGTAALDLAVEAVLDARLAWCADNDPAAALLLSHRFPHVANLGDLTAVDWHTVPRVDIVTAGFPCQDISYAGRGAGLMEGTRSGLWRTIAQAVRVLAPCFVFVENVPALRRRGLDTVTADLAASGYDLAWRCLRASDVGAPHRRDRLFLLGISTSAAAGDPHRLRLHRPQPDPAHRTRPQPPHADRPDPVAGRNTRCSVPDTRPESGYHRYHRGGLRREGSRRHGAGPATHPAGRRRCQGQPGTEGLEGRPLPALGDRCHHHHSLHTADLTSRHTNWREYEPAIRRWEGILGRPAPPPTCPGRTGSPVLAPEFVEWMMAFSIGWTAVPGISRSARLRLLGNSVVVNQAAYALAALLQQHAAPDRN